MAGVASSGSVPRSYDCGTAASDFPDHLATRKVFIYVLEFRRMPCKANVSDAVSRGDLEMARRMG